MKLTVEEDPNGPVKGPAEGLRWGTGEGGYTLEGGNDLAGSLDTEIKVRGLSSRQMTES